MSEEKEIAMDEFYGASLMAVQCCKCRDFIDSKPGPLGGISHSLCPECFEQEMQKADIHASAAAG